MRTVNGHQCTRPYPKPSTGLCPPLSPNAWEPLVGGGGGGGGGGAASSVTMGTLMSAGRGADGLAKSCNQVALTGQPQLPTYTSPQVTHTR